MTGKQVNHSERAHARLSASGAERWINCTPSVSLEDQLPDKPSTFYMEEGTAAHELSEIRLHHYVTIPDAPSLSERARKAKIIENSEYYNAEMEEYIKQYCEYVLERYNEARSRSKDALIMLEQRFDLSNWVPESFGTADIMIISDGVLEVVDLKYGKGKEVSAVGNPQMRLYALGALAQYDAQYNIHTVRMTIHQPRIDNISFDEISADELYDWGDSIVKPAAQLAHSGEGDFKPGSHCQFCKAKAICRARTDAVKQATAKREHDPRTLTVEELAEVLHMVDTISRWATDVKEYAQYMAENKNVKFPGWKLVEGRSDRKITDPQELADRIELFYEDANVWKEPQLKTLGALEKEIGKKKFEEVSQGLIVKPTGKPTLVTEADRRPEISSVSAAQSEFDEIE